MDSPHPRPPSGLDRGSEEGAGGGPRPHWGQAGRGRTRADPAPQRPVLVMGSQGGHRAGGTSLAPEGPRKWHLFCGGGGP